MRGQRPVDAAQVMAEYPLEPLAMGARHLALKPGGTERQDYTATAHLGLGGALYHVGSGIEDGGGDDGIGRVKTAAPQLMGGPIGHQRLALEGDGDDELRRQLSLGGKVGLVDYVLVVKEDAVLNHQVLYSSCEQTPFADAGISYHSVSHAHFDHFEVLNDQPAKLLRILECYISPRKIK
ncbi:hypothetical protein D3C80_831920 [compost metagenome]